MKFWKGRRYKAHGLALLHVAEQGVEYKRGLTRFSVTALLLAGLLFSPISTFATMTLGMGLGAPASFAIPALIAEVASLAGVSLSPQEMLVIYYGSGVGGAVAVETIFSLPIFVSYFSHSPFAAGAIIDGRNILEYTPHWLYPCTLSRVVELRKLLSPELAGTVLLLLLTYLLSLALGVSLSTMIAKVYLEVERLEFPFAQVDVSLVTFLSERPGDEASKLLLSMVAGVVWGLLTYMPPLLAGVQIIPLVLWDLSPPLSNYLPGGVFAISTVLTNYLAGFVVPPLAAIYMFLTSVIVYTVIQSLCTTVFASWFPEWAQEYMRGMGYITLSSRAAIRLWYAPLLGASIGAAVFLALRSWRSLIRVFRGLFAARERAAVLTGLPSTRVLMAVFILSSLALAMLYHYMVPGVPLWLVLLWLIPLNFAGAIITSVMGGETGFVPPVFVNLWPIAVYSTPYRGYAAYLLPPGGGLTGLGASWLCQQMRAAVSTRTRPKDILVVYVASGLVVCVVSILTLDLLWSLAPIPSVVYPTTIYSYPAQAVQLVMLSTRQIRITAERIVVPMGLVLLVSSLGQVASRFGVPWSLAGFYAGIFSDPVATFPIFVGSLVGNYLLSRIFGSRDRWLHYRGYLVAGEALGEGVIVMGVVAISFMMKAGWIWPW